MELSKEIEKSFPKIRKLFTEEKLFEFSQTTVAGLEKYNWGLGTMIRLKLLKSKSSLYQVFLQSGFTDRDEMTMEIIREFHKICRE